MYIPILSSTFPEPRPGPHATGYAVARIPVAPGERYVGGPKLKTGAPALSLTESVLAIYYPTPPRPLAAGVPWVPEPLAGAVAGYATYLRKNFGSWSAWALGLVLGRVRMPVHAAAPPSAGRFPLVLFSHGLVGTRNTYSHFCSSLASEGYVVVALEHADGSGPCVIREGEERLFTRLGQTDLWTDDGTDPAVAPQMMVWRAHQLDFRVREVYAAYNGFKRFLSGEGETDGEVSLADQLKDKVDVQDLQLMGHSFGGATILRLLQTAPHAEPLPIKRAVLLDPWMEPFGRVLPSSPATTAAPATQIINSEDWANNSFFPAEKKAARDLGAALCSIVGLGHQGFSDFGLLSLKSKAREYLQTIHTLTMARLRDQPYPLEGEEDGGEPRRVEGRLAGEPGDVIRHF
ncbi:hypothetical protein CC85DRAFT_329757 [Cutaneotrichosporon oleaginosum]|uniref:1-alkyl-2-acetylglycerophosphocholine esterase n=1 Tax=Cutaneotrichosporon oleaginosum TaxID=879819 RepID=A0A0J0XHL1_9TREE|nr:uncharacterized protein CC85DRAFT_329757 [Cutaneotrichosporon oleaginosum]KLT40591.1 hypothetical protein CC85DRAFT_329757 [Cutaneotrichosporon oleaginosum]TXT03916.1 hypothetical protein COLE_07613 [Cutaneotrichosporon oleaginosum]